MTSLNVDREQGQAPAFVLGLSALIASHWHTPALLLYQLETSALSMLVAVAVWPVGCHVSTLLPHRDNAPGQGSKMSVIRKRV